MLVTRQCIPVCNLTLRTWLGNKPIRHSDLLTSKQHMPQVDKFLCMCITQQSILGHSSRIGDITMGSIWAASLSVLHKNIQPLEKYAAFLWIITKAQISGMISLQEKKGNFLYSLVFLSYTIWREVLPKPNFIHNKFRYISNKMYCNYCIGSSCPYAIYLTKSFLCRGIWSSWENHTPSLHSISSVVKWGEKIRPIFFTGWWWGSNKWDKAKVPKLFGTRDQFHER